MVMERSKSDYHLLLVAFDASFFYVQIYLKFHVFFSTGEIMAAPNTVKMHACLQTACSQCKYYWWVFLSFQIFKNACMT